jgi:hypothetical protein
MVLLNLAAFSVALRATENAARLSGFQRREAALKPAC